MSKPITLIIAAMILLSSCNKEDPQPPITQQDLVMQTATIKVSNNDWEKYGIPGDDIHGYAATANARLITGSIATDGVVKLHLQRPNGGWLELPATIAQGGPEGMNWNFTYQTGSVSIRVDRNGAAVSPPDQPLVFRVTAGPK